MQRRRRLEEPAEELQLRRLRLLEGLAGEQRRQRRPRWELLVQEVRRKPPQQRFVALGLERNLRPQSRLAVPAQEGRTPWRQRQSQQPQWGSQRTTEKQRPSGLRHSLGRRRLQVERQFEPLAPRSFGFVERWIALALGHLAWLVVVRSPAMSPLPISRGLRPMSQKRNSSEGLGVSLSWL